MRYIAVVEVKEVDVKVVEVNVAVVNVVVVKVFEVKKRPRDFGNVEKFTVVLAASGAAVELLLTAVEGAGG